MYFHSVQANCGYIMVHYYTQINEEHNYNIYVTRSAKRGLIYYIIPFHNMTCGVYKQWNGLLEWLNGIFHISFYIQLLPLSQQIIGFPLKSALLAQFTSP